MVEQLLVSPSLPALKAPPVLLLFCQPAHAQPIIVRGGLTANLKNIEQSCAERLWGRLAGLLGRLEGVMGAFWGPLGRLGSLLGRLGRVRRALYRFWGSLGASSGPFGGLLGIS